MLMLILEQIQSTTESALNHLMKVFTSLKITSYTGENVGKVTSVIRAIYNVLRSASDGLSGGSYVPPMTSTSLYFRSFRPPVCLNSIRPSGRRQ